MGEYGGLYSAWSVKSIGGLQGPGFDAWPRKKGQYVKFQINPSVRNFDSIVSLGHGV